MATISSRNIRIIIIIDCQSVECASQIYLRTYMPAIKVISFPIVLVNPNPKLVIQDVLELFLM